MTTLTYSTVIAAPRQVCFDLSRSIDFHRFNMQHTNEEAIGGVTTGLINKGESVVWKATHFGISQIMSVKITMMVFNVAFMDEMVEGPFKGFTHLHRFDEHNGGTLMTDSFEYQTPFGIVGKLFDKVILKRYMSRLLQHRNRMIKQAAESGEWQKFF